MRADDLEDDVTMAVNYPKNAPLRVGNVILNKGDRCIVIGYTNQEDASENHCTAADAAEVLTRRFTGREDNGQLYNVDVQQSNNVMTLKYDRTVSDSTYHVTWKLTVPVIARRDEPKEATGKTKNGKEKPPAMKTVMKKKVVKGKKK